MYTYDSFCFTRDQGSRMNFLMSVLCVVAHPDDETVFCGGTLALLADQGADIHLLSLTRGEGGEAGEPPLCSRAELGTVREREMRCAAEKLGVRTVEFLGYVDPDVGTDNTLSAPAVDRETLVEQLIVVMRRRSPRIVLTHGVNGEYGHPAHCLTHHAVREAARRLEKPPAVYSFSAWYPDHPYSRLANVDDRADFLVAVTSRLEAKEAAALCHATQHALFVRRRSQLAGHPVSVREVLLTTEAFRRVPVTEGVPPEKPGPLELCLGPEYCQPLALSD